MTEGPSLQQLELRTLFCGECHNHATPLAALLMALYVDVGAFPAVTREPIQDFLYTQYFHCH
jgi:hypothetical protein